MLSLNFGCHGQSQNSILMTLLSKGYSEKTDSYKYRYLVRAVQVEVK